jgi:ABC-type lipoprotein export system ATPase subunit
VIGQRQTSAIEQFVAATRPLEIAAPGAVSSSLPMTKIQAPEGAVEATEGLGDAKFPFVIRSTRGLGLAVFVAFDMDLPPVRTWSDRPRLMSRLLELVLSDAAPEDSYRSDMGPVAHVGFSDLVGQLRMALDQFAGIRLVPFSWIAALVGLYILLIGPLDYVLLRRFGRLEWTWFTSTALIVGFLALAVWLAFTWKGRDVRMNQVSVVDMDLTSGTLRGTTWAHLYTPRTERVTVRTVPSAEFPYRDPPSQITSWEGLPGDGFGGLERVDRTQFFSEPYLMRAQFLPSQAGQGELVDLPLAVWSSRAVIGQWWAKFDEKIRGSFRHPLDRARAGRRGLVRLHRPQRSRQDDDHADLATLLNPTWGEAYVCGHSIYTKPKEIRRLVGYMPDFFGVYDDMKVIEYLEFFAAAYRINGSAAAQSLRRDARPGRLGLQARRVRQHALARPDAAARLARVLLHDPQVLLLDEPLSGLDPRARIEMRNLLRRLGQMGKTIIVSSHILPELADICNKIGIMRRS